MGVFRQRLEVCFFQARWFAVARGSGKVATDAVILSTYDLLSGGTFMQELLIYIDRSRITWQTPSQLTSVSNYLLCVGQMRQFKCSSRTAACVQRGRYAELPLVAQQLKRSWACAVAAGNSAGDSAACIRAWCTPVKGVQKRRAGRLSSWALTVLEHKQARQVL